MPNSVAIVTADGGDFKGILQGTPNLTHVMSAL